MLHPCNASAAQLGDDDVTTKATPPHAVSLELSSRYYLSVSSPEIVQSSLRAGLDITTIMISAHCLAAVALFSIVSGYSVQDESSESRPAILNLDPAVTVGGLTAQMAGFRCPNSAFKPNTKLTFETEECLNGELYPNQNIKTLQTPRCADGSRPTFSYYLHQGCTGKAYFSAKMSGADQLDCYWSGPTKEWSIIFRCDAPAPKLSHSNAGPSSSDVSSVAEVVPHFSSECRDIPVGNTGYNLRADESCATTFGGAIKITKPAICANGTRALWARWEDAACGRGKLSARYGLTELQDSDIGKCLSLGSASSHSKVRSIAFWCDGPADGENGESKGSSRAFVWGLILCSTGTFLLIAGGLYAICYTSLVPKLKVSNSIPTWQWLLTWAAGFLRQGRCYYSMI